MRFLIVALFCALSYAQTDKWFNRISTFAICSQMDVNCNIDDETVAEIVYATDDGNTIVYTNSPQNSVGIVDISDPHNPVGGGEFQLSGEPTSVVVKNDMILVAVNTSPSFTEPNGELCVLSIATGEMLASLPLNGQPDSIALSPDGNYAAVAIENERDEDFGDGEIPQLPGGWVSVVDTSSEDPAFWTTSDVHLSALQGITEAADSEPEYVSINEDNLCVVTLQENNGIVLIDLETRSIVRAFDAGSVTLANVDATEDGRIDLSEEITKTREPDGVVWISSEHFATANEGDMNGGSRSFSIFDVEGNVVYDSGYEMDHIAAMYGHYPESRSENKGNEPENVSFGVFDGTGYLFVNSERSSLVFVYDVSEPSQPQFIQAMPADAGPEGGITIPARNLLVVGSEADEREAKLRSVINIYERSSDPPMYPMIVSQLREDLTPIPWGALSGLAAEIRSTGNKHIMYSIEDSFYSKSRIFTIDASTVPAVITDDLQIYDNNGILAAVDASMVNDDMTVNLDPEGIAVPPTSAGLWVCSEGKATADDPGFKPNLLVKVNAEGEIEELVTLPDDVSQTQIKYGFEGCAFGSGAFSDKLVVGFQRAWGEDSNPMIGAWSTSEQAWEFYYYPLDAAESQNGGWVGISDIAPLGDGGKFFVLERDNQRGFDAEIKRVYLIDLGEESVGETISKTLVRDLKDDLLMTNGMVAEKVEGLTVDQDGNAYIVVDNDGVSDNAGETLFFAAFETAYRPLLSIATPTTGGEAYVMHDGPCAMYTPSEDECAADSTLVYSMSGTPEECAQECEERADCKQLTITMQDKETAWCWLLSSEYMAGEMDKWQYVQRPVTAEAGMTCCLSSASEHMKMSSCTENGCMITQEIGYFPGGSASIKLMANLANEGEMAAVYVNNKYAAMCTEASCGEYTECSTPSLEEMEKLTISVMSMPTASTCGDSALSVETTLMYGGDMSDDDDESESADTPDTDESESADTPDTDESDESTDTDESSESAEEDPCSCSGSMGWSSETESCQEGSTTSCDECPTMSGCDSSTCAEASCPMEYDAMRLCQCTANCAEYGNCCADASTCLEAESDSDESAEPMSCTTNSDCPNYKLYPSADGGWCDGGVCSTCDAEGFLECYTYDFPNGFDYNAMDSCVQACACDLEFLGSESKSPPVTTDGVPNGMVYKWADATRLPEECQGVCFGPGCYDKVSDSCCSSGEFGGAEVFADLSSTFANGETCVSVSFGSETVMLAGGCGTSGKFFYGEQCGGSTFGPFAGIGADSVCYQPDTDCRCNAYVETTEAGCYRVGSIPAMPGMPQELYFLDVVDPVCRDRGTPDNGGDGGDSGDDYEDCYEVWQLESRCNGDYEVYEDQTPASCLIEAATRGYTYFSHHSGNNKCRVWMTDNCDNPRGANAAWTTYRSIC